MKTSTIFLLCTILLLGISSCRKDFEYEPASQKFRFSRDTLYLDTLFTNIRSETYGIKIYNQENKDVLIPHIYLKNGAQSVYKINVDGNPGFDFVDVPIRAKDSVFVFVDAAPNASIPNSSLVVEDLLVQSQAGLQTVKLVSVVEDVEFFHPTSGQSELVITQNTTWNNNKSKVIFGDLKISGNATLTIEKSTKVYFHHQSSLLIDTGSKLLINGALNEEVILRGDRHDIKYDTLPANWKNIELFPQSMATINYAKISGGYNALNLQQAQLNISNTRIDNFYYAGIFALNSVINASNLLCNNAGEASLYLASGGFYDFNQCTFANYTSPAGGNAYGLFLSNTYTNISGSALTGDVIMAHFGNSIFYGRGSNAIAFNKNSTNNFNYSFDNCLIKYSNQNNYNPMADTNFNNCIFNMDPKFKNTLASKNDLSLLTGSAAINKGSTSIALLYPLDYYKKNRTAAPNLGALQ